MRSAKTVGASPASLFLYVEKVDRVVAKAVGLGGRGLDRGLLMGRVQASDACAGQHVTEPSRPEQRLVQGFSDRRKILQSRQMELFVESVHRKNIMVNKGESVGRRTRTVVFFAGEEVIEDLSAELAPSHSGAFGQFGRRRRNVIHPPMSEGRCDVVQYDDETGCPLRSVGPRQLWRFISGGASIRGTGINAIDYVVVDRTDGQL